VLTYYLDLPIAEAASVLGIPTGTMKSRLHRAISALRATVDADDRPFATTAERTT
jgi:RNA polymerase sigma-70 factor, ECF subfamily